MDRLRKAVATPSWGGRGLCPPPISISQNVSTLRFPEIRRLASNNGSCPEMFQQWTNLLQRWLIFKDEMIRFMDHVVIASSSRHVRSVYLI